MLGWSTKEDIAALYGRPYEAVNDRLYTYQEEGSATSYYRLGFRKKAFWRISQFATYPMGANNNASRRPNAGAGGI